MFDVELRSFYLTVDVELRSLYLTFKWNNLIKFLQWGAVIGTYNLDNSYSFFFGNSRFHCETSLKRPTEAPTTVLEYVRRSKCRRNVVSFTLLQLYPRVKGRECCRKKKGRQKTEVRRKEVGSGGELETRFVSCRHLEAISYRFTRAPTKVSVHLHLESSSGIVRYRYCNACYEYRPESCGLGLWLALLVRMPPKDVKRLNSSRNLFDGDFHPSSSIPR